jgi:sugar/nucleoside kinase (ribokinase family)
MTEPAGVDDLLIVGGLTIDRFADDRLAPGGSVLHASRAAARAGLVTSVVTVSGPEPIAHEGLTEMRAITRLLEVVGADETIRFRHRESPQGRRLWLECPGGSIVLSAEVERRLGMAAILFAPVAAEIDARILLTWDGSWRRGAILQGWLRRADEGAEVEPIRPDDLADELVAALASLDVLVASREDLLAAADAPFDQLHALRRRVGGSPMLIVTDGPDGVWIDDGHGEARHLSAPWRVEGVPMVGAGDAFAALFVAKLGASRSVRSEVDAAAHEAMRGVAEILDERRG